MAGAGRQPHPAGSVQQGEKLPLDGQGQIPIARAVPEGEGAAGKHGLELQLDLVAPLFHRRVRGAVQGQPLEHISALGLPDKHVHRCPQSHTEHYRPYTALQMGLQVPAGEEQAAGQTHAVLLLKYIVTAPGPAEPGRLAYVPATELGLVSQVRSGLVRGTAHVT